MKKITLSFSILFCSATLWSNSSSDSSIVRRSATATRITVAPKIDGQLDDECWKSAIVTGDFIQNSPKENSPVSFPTEVRITYDDAALYVGAMCYDNSPDSIMRQLGLRDNWPNADQFRVVFDTYNTQQDAFDFSVTASGVQGDSRVSDYNFDAVWYSNVKILSNGWSVEMAIPWSAFRFPTTNIQTWGFQSSRSVTRKNEFDQWALTPKDKPNPMKYWGTLEGLSDIHAPIRLSFTPYISGIVEKDSRFGPSKPAASVAGGLGLKYGINESFTLDMTLLPDFSQVRSDDVFKNLSPFEIQFSEQRPFFTEGTDLFAQGSIFYSRRIGKTPSGFYSAPYLTTASEKITKNPNQARLLNATKVTGRTNEGLGIGVLNAYVDNTYAIATDTITGITRKILTEPSANYNIFVFDKQMANSSDIYVTNTNVIRSHGARSANVTAAGFGINNKKSSWNFAGDGAVSDVLEPTYTSGNFDSNIGYYFRMGIKKNSGKVQYGINRNQVNKNWDCNDMGITRQTNYSDNEAFISYSLYNPWKIFNNTYSNLSLSYSDNLETKEMSSLNVSMFNMVTFTNFWYGYLGFEVEPVDSKDFYEPREAGRYFLRTRSRSLFGGLNSNSNKKLTLGLNWHYGKTAVVSPTIPANPFGGGGINLGLRIGNRFSLYAYGDFGDDYGDRGWVGEESNGDIVFGRRILQDWSSSLYSSFVFTRDMSISFGGRYFWSTGHYLSYYILNADGTLTDYISFTGAGTNDYSFNSFNIDMIYTWNFTPGSTLSIGWKQNILDEQSIIDYNYFHNFKNTIGGPQLNQVSVRVLYYLDYNYIARSGNKKK